MKFTETPHNEGRRWSKRSVVQASFESHRELRGIDEEGLVRSVRTRDDGAMQYRRHALIATKEISRISGLSMAKRDFFFGGPSETAPLLVGGMGAEAAAGLTLCPGLLPSLCFLAITSSKNLLTRPSRHCDFRTNSRTGSAWREQRRTVCRGQ
jgi:hypothetical protein